MSEMDDLIRANREWTERLVARQKALHANGGRYTRESGVMQKMERKGGSVDSSYVPKNSRKKFTPEEEETIREMYRNRARDKEVAMALGRKLSQIKSYKRLHGLSKTRM